MRFNVLIFVWIGALVLPRVTWAGSAPEGDFSYTVSEGKATITGYSGPGGDLNGDDSLFMRLVVEESAL